MLIEEDNLPERYGGKLNWTFEDEPALDADTKEHIGEMPKGPTAWIHGRVTKLGAETHETTS